VTHSRSFCERKAKIIALSERALSVVFRFVSLSVTYIEVCFSVLQSSF